jgi:hypothetical protein
MMAIPERTRQIFISDLGWIEVYLNRFSVIAQVVIGGILFRSPRIPDPGTNDTRDTPEPEVRSPESAKRKCGRFRFRRC